MVPLPAQITPLFTSTYDTRDFYKKLQISRGFSLKIDVLSGIIYKGEDYGNSKSS